MTAAPRRRRHYGYGTKELLVKENRIIIQQFKNLSEVTVIAVLAKSLALPQGVAVYRPENVIRSLDLFVVLANVNLIGAHLVGSLTSLGLLNWLEQ
jgi:Protein of unknown function (DUF3611)